jgi:hypothetical protein
MTGPPREQAFADPWRKSGIEGTGRSSVSTGDGDEVAAQQPLSIGATVHSRPTVDNRTLGFSAAKRTVVKGPVT